MPGDLLEVLLREVAMTSRKYTCFMLMLPNVSKPDWELISTGAAAMQFLFATRKSKLVKRKCETSPDFP